jgi:hypothetical protein
MKGAILPAVVVSLALVAVASAQSGIGRADPDGDFLRALGERFDQGPGAEISESLVEMLGRSAERMLGQADSVVDAAADAKGAAGLSADGLAGARGRLAGYGRALGGFMTAASYAVKGLDALGDYPKLSDLDVDIDLSDGPGVPSECEPGSSCWACYEKPVRDIEFHRYYLEVARSIYQSQKRYVDWAIGFGDSVSPIHGVSGLAWQAEKRGILQAFDKLKTSVKKRYDGYLDGQERALRAFAACEKSEFGVDGWYERYGFIYMSFLRGRYVVD